MYIWGFSAIVVSCKIKKCTLQVATPVFIGEFTNYISKQPVPRNIIKCISII